MDEFMGRFGTLVREWDRLCREVEELRTAIANERMRMDSMTETDNIVTRTLNSTIDEKCKRLAEIELYRVYK